MKKYIHAGSVGLFIIYFISSFVFSFIFVAPTASAMMIAPSGYSSVAFIPGLEGSRLYAPGMLMENKLWEPFWNADLDKLDMDANGKSIRGDVYTRDIVDNIKVGLINTPYTIYGDFSKYLDGLTDSGTISEWKALPYDWRLDLSDVVNGGVLETNDNISFLTPTSSDISYMISQIQDLADRSFTNKVTIVTHSNGGLVVKALIQKLQDLKAQGQNNLVDHIDNIIMVSAPNLGAMGSAASLLHGIGTHYLGGFMANESHARAMAKNMPSAYNLLPSQKYFENNLWPLITFATSTDTFSNFSKVYGRNITDSATFERFLTGVDGRPEPSFADTTNPGVLNEVLLTKADDRHAGLDAWQFPPNINVIQIAGVGIETLAGISYEKGSACSMDIVVCKDTLDPEPMTSVDGDGTVLASSALTNLGTQLYFNLNKYNDPDYGPKHNRQHADILETTNIQDLVTNILTGTTNLPDLITTDKPETGNKRLTVAAHSPISLDAYDTEGNHTGLVNNPDPSSDIQLVEQNIPNSFYTNFGEGKYLGFDLGTPTTIVFQGTDYGSFTLDTTLSQGNSVMATSKFVDIPVTPELKGSIINATSSAPTLALDVDGDGVVDVVATSTVAFDPILYLEIMKETVDSFDLKKPAEKALVQKLDKLENLIKKGKLNNADKQVQKFIKKINRTNKRLRKIDDSERNQLVQMLSNLADNLL